MKDIRFRVLFLASWYPSRADNVLGMFVKRKAEAMSKKCDVAVLYIRKDDRLTEKIYDITTNLENNVFTCRVFFQPYGKGFVNAVFYNIRFIKSFFLGLKEIKKNWGNFDLIHVNVVDRAGYFALIIKWFKGIKYVITEHSTPDIKYLRGESRNTYIKLKSLRKIVIKNAGYINVDSTASMKYWNKVGLTGNYGIIQNVVEVHPQFLDFTKNNTDNKKRAVHISVLIERKNVADIIRAYAHIYHKLNRKNIEFHIVGVGPQKQMLEDLASELKILNKCVFFHGFVDEETKIKLLVNSDFHILNSDEEGFSVVTAESILYGIPVIATKCGGPEDFVPKEVGLLINRRNLHELINSILFMIDNSQNYDKKVLQEFGKSKFSPDVICEQTYNVYKLAATTWKAGNTSQRISIDPNWQVLDVGSGHQPNRRANVILERYLGNTIHRTTQTVLIPVDKTLIVADAHYLPFKDKSFDYIITSHIAEHVDNPEKFCIEIQRVGRAGYFETPGPLTEFLMPTKSHKWVVKKDENSVNFIKNTYSKPFSKLFFRVFYLNRDGYSDETLKSENPIIKLFNHLLVKFWKFIPQAYTKFEWKNNFKVNTISE
jgi:glycosyltransferase involved in cell wall biosynthesis